MESKSMTYRAPLCKQAGCGNHVWSQYCAVHRDAKLHELSNADPSTLSIAEKSLLRESSKRENEVSIAIGHEVQNVLPGFFEDMPTADEMEYAALNVCFTANSASIARDFAIHKSSGQSTDNLMPPVVDYVETEHLDAHEINDAANRYDFFGRSTDDASIVSSYLIKKGWEARIARGDRTDSDGNPVVADVEEYAAMKQMNWLDDGRIDDYMEGLDGRLEPAQELVSAYLDKQAAMRTHDRSVAERMTAARQEFGDNRMSGYASSPYETLADHRDQAWTQSYAPAEQTAQMDAQRAAAYRSYNPTPSTGQNAGSPKYVTDDGHILDENMNIIGRQNNIAPHPATVPPVQHQQQSSGRIPEGMIRQNNSQWRSPDEHWSQMQHSAQRNDDVRDESVGKKFIKGTGKAAGAVIRSGWRIGWAFHDAKREVDEKNQQRLAAYNQDRANQEIIRMGKESRKKNSWF